MNHSQRTVLVIGLGLLALPVLGVLGLVLEDEPLPADFVKFTALFTLVVAGWAAAAFFIYEAEIDHQHPTLEHDLDYLADEIKRLHGEPPTH